MYFIQLLRSDINFERNVSGIFDAKKEVEHRKSKFSDGLGGGRRDTVDLLKSIEPRIADDLTKRIVGSTIHKLSVLSDSGCSELIFSTKKRKIAERDSSIRNRLAKPGEHVRKSRIDRDKKQARKNDIAL